MFMFYDTFCLLFTSQTYSFPLFSRPSEFNKQRKYGLKLTVQSQCFCSSSSNDENVYVYFMHSVNFLFENKINVQRRTKLFGGKCLWEVYARVSDNREKPS